MISDLCFPGRFSSPRGAEHNLRRRATGLAAKVLATALLLVCLSGTCQAMDQPPAAAPQQRAWPLNHLVADMRSTGSFPSPDLAEVASLLNSLTDDQISLLAQYYCLTRAKTEQDARLFAIELSETQEALAQAKAECADLLTQQQVQIEQTYADLAPLNASCQTLCQVAYASIPGWCASIGTPSPFGTITVAATSVLSSRRFTAAPTPPPSIASSTTWAAAITIGTAGPIFTTISRESRSWPIRPVAHPAVCPPQGPEPPMSRPGTPRPRSQNRAARRSGRTAVCLLLSGMTPRCRRSTRARPVANRARQGALHSRCPWHACSHTSSRAAPSQRRPSAAAQAAAALQRVARAQPRSQHVAQAHVTFAPSRRK